MSLRERIVVILFVIFCTYAGLEYAAYHRLIYPVFVQQEQQQAQASVDSAKRAIDGELLLLQQQIAGDARSGALYGLLANQAPQAGYANDQIDFIVLFDYRWNVVHRQLPEGLMPAGDSEQFFFRGDEPFLTKQQMGFSKKQLIPCGDFHLFTICEPILSAPDSTAVEGMVLAGQVLTDKRIQAIRKRHNLDFNWSFLVTEEQQGRYGDILAHISPEEPFHFAPVSDRFMECSTVLFDSRNEPVLILQTIHDKVVSSSGKATIDKLMLVKLGIGFGAILFLTALLQMMMISPIKQLIRHVSKFGRAGCPSQKIHLSRTDEIGQLASEFDHMCQRLQNAQIKLMEKSYVTGAAEMSSGILHNVRNALSPITTQIERIKDHFQTIPLQNLEQAQTELQTGSLSPQRREDLVRFVELTFQHVLLNLKDMVTGLTELSEQVVQIEDMLNNRRMLGGKLDRYVEFIEPIQLLNNALEIVPESFRDSHRIHIHPAIRKLPSIPVHPTTFIQILQNLLINASESLEREKPLYPRIDVTCTMEPRESVEMLHWTIRDNGAGIAPDKLETIFERGASSKNQGLTGIGLHWCANTINAMQGRLWAESKGAHRGACLHLLIPMAAEECPAAAQEA